jgi:hypothetical protein
LLWDTRKLVQEEIMVKGFLEGGKENSDAKTGVKSF